MFAIQYSRIDDTQDPGAAVVPPVPQATFSSFGTPVTAFTLEATSAVAENSGMIDSRSNTGYAYLMTDGAGANIIIVRKSDGVKTGTVTITGQTFTDKEDMAYNSVDSCIYIADTGNNGFTRTNQQLVKISEPTATGNVSLAGTSYPITYDNVGFTAGNPEQNCEAVMFDPSGRCWLVAKGGTGVESRRGIFRGPDTLTTTGPNTFTRVASGPRNVTSCDWHPTLNFFVTMTAGTALDPMEGFEANVYVVDDSTDTTPTLTNTNTIAITRTTVDLNKGPFEALCFTTGGGNLLAGIDTGGDHQNSSIYRVPVVLSTDSVVPDITVSATDGGALAITSTPVALVKTTPPDPGTLTSRRVFSSNSIYKQIGVCTHINFSKDIWKWRNYWSLLIKDHDYYYARSSVDDNTVGIDAMDNAVRDGYKYIIVALPEDTLDTADMSVATQNATRQKLAWLASDYADTIVAIEGLNEPNQSRSGAALPTNWPEICVFWQKFLYNEVRALSALNHVEILGPSMHDTALDQSNGDHLLYLKYGTRSITPVAGKESIVPYVTRWGLHSYSKGNIPTTSLDNRLGYYTDAFGVNVKIWATETGYQNNLGLTRGFIPVRQEAAGVYVPRAMLEFPRKNIYWTRYEMLDDPDPGVKSTTQANFGQIMVDEGEDITQSDRDISAASQGTINARTPTQVYEDRIIARTPSATTWTLKPEWTQGKALLAKLKDMGSGATFDTDYTPSNVGVEIASSNPATSDKLDWMLIGKRDGSVKLFLWRNIQIQSTTYPYSMFTTGVGDINVRVEDAAGVRTVAVGPELKDIVIRRTSSG